MMSISTHGMASVAVLCVLYAIFQQPQGLDAHSAGIYFLIYMTGMVVWGRPSLVTRKNLWILHTWYTALVVLWGFYAALAWPTVFMHYETVFLLYRIGFAMAFPAPGVNFFLTVVAEVPSVISSLHPETACLGLPFFHIVSKRVQALFISYSAWRYDQLQASQVRSDLKASGYLRAKKTMERLLADMCDAVVELDHSLGIRQRCPKLAAFLLRVGGNELQNDSFASLAFTEEDRNRFVDFVQQRAVPMEHEQHLRDPGRGHSMFMSLRDVDGSPVPVQVFHSCHHDLPNEVCHIIGVQGVQEDHIHDRVGGMADGFGEVTRTRDHGDLAQPSVTVGSWRDGSDSESVASVASSNSSAMSSDVDIPLAPLVEENMVLSPISVIFDGASFAVIGCTVGFQALAGPMLFKADLAKYILNFRKFCEWITEELRVFGHAVQPSTFQIRIAPPTLGAKRPKVEFQAVAGIEWVGTEVKASQLGVELPEDSAQHTFGALIVLGLWQAERHNRKKDRVRRSRGRRAARRQQAPTLPSAPSVSSPRLHIL